MLRAGQSPLRNLHSREWLCHNAVGAAMLLRSRDANFRLSRNDTTARPLLHGLSLEELRDAFNDFDHPQIPKPEDENSKMTSRWISACIRKA